MSVCLHIWRVPARRVPAALWCMATDPRRLRRVPGMRFVKLLGTAPDNRFGPAGVDPTRWAALTVSVGPPPAFPRWMEIAVAGCRFDLRPISSRGTWSGCEPFDLGPRREPCGLGPECEPCGLGPECEPFDLGPGSGPETGALPQGEPDPSSGPARSGLAGGLMVALTRARLRPGKAVRFWRAIGPVAGALFGSPGLVAAFGIGEAPLGWQGTISVWRSHADLVRFAYRHPEHRRAIERTATVNWYAEELFARFSVLDIHGDTGVIGWVEGRQLPE